MDHVASGVKVSCVFLSVVFTGYCFCEFVITFSMKPEVCCLYIASDNNVCKVARNVIEKCV